MRGGRVERRAGERRLDPRVEPVVEALRDLLHDRRLTQAEIEKRANLPRKYLSRLLNGHVDMKLIHIMDVLDAAGVAPQDLFCRLCGEQGDRPSRQPTAVPTDMAEVLRQLQRRVEDLEERRG